MSTHRIGDRALAWLPPHDIEDSARRQILNLAGLPIVFRHVAVMPDCHLGKGATVGTVLPTQRAVIPAAVGVDIGCGMIAVRTTLAASDLPDGLEPLRRAIEAAVPAGRAATTSSSRAPPRPRRCAQARGPARRLHRRRQELGARGRLARLGQPLHRARAGRGRRRVGRAALGLARDRQQAGERYIAGARGVEAPRRQAARSRPRLAGRGHASFDDYVRDLHWAQSFARMNRDEMMDRVMGEIARAVGRAAGEIESSASTATTTSRRRKCTSARRSGSRARARSR
jgi:tRNA-splicing ligase RtcB